MRRGRDLSDEHCRTYVRKTPWVAFPVVIPTPTKLVPWLHSATRWTIRLSEDRFECPAFGPDRDTHEHESEAIVCVREQDRRERVALAWGRCLLRWGSKHKQT